MAELASDIDTFSYADPTDPRLKRLFIRIVERVSGQPYLKWLYEENRANPVPGEDFWDAAIRKLELRLRYNEDALKQWPRTGPLVLVANHPFGVLDGLIICHLVAKVRKFGSWPFGSCDPSWARIAWMKASTAGENRRPAIETNETTRTTSGSLTGWVRTPGMVGENSGRKQTPKPAATIIWIQSSRSL